MERYLAAIDLGTTTVEASLLRPDGSAAAKHGFLNPQMKYGSDVISRMTFLQKHPESDALREGVLAEMRDVLQKMLSWQRAEYPKDLSQIIVTCNSVMAAILLKVPTEPLGVAPFGMPLAHTGEFSLDGIPGYVPVGTSAFLGSDSCGGAWALPVGEDELLMDLGTNGEMLLRHDGRIHGASAACGPAFENCTRSQGIYGSTTLSVLSNLLRTGRIPSDGTLPPEIAEKGIEFQSIRITAKILHDVQLASAAIYATFLCLLKRAGCTVDDIRHIYLSGGFGFHLSLRDAGTIGLIPEKLLDRVKISGNTSLLAAEKLSLEGLNEYDVFREGIVSHQFAGDPEYEGLFYDSMILQARR